TPTGSGRIKTTEISLYPNCRGVNSEYLSLRAVGYYDFSLEVNGIELTLKQCCIVFNYQSISRGMR
ncbi:MAG: hypothetical protein JSU58_00770, partial [Dehalococcoidales bacterium]